MLAHTMIEFKFKPGTTVRLKNAPEVKFFIFYGEYRVGEANGDVTIAYTGRFSCRGMVRMDDFLETELEEIPPFDDVMYHWQAIKEICVVKSEWGLAEDVRKAMCELNDKMINMRASLDNSKADITQTVQTAPPEISETSNAAPAAST